MTVLHLDIETFSERDLKREGLYRYAADPSTELLVVCYALDDAPVQTWVPTDDPLIPQDLYDHIVAGGEVRAHNAGFERTVLNGAAGERLGFPKISIEQCVCTAAKAAAHGLPRALGDAAAALGTHAKDGVGRMDMLQLSKPRTGRIPRWTPENAPERFERLYRYCADDVEAERGIDAAIPDLPPDEQAVYALDQAINDRGVAVDLEATEAALALIAEYKAELKARCIKITGMNPTQTGKLADWVRTHGYPSLPNLQADTVHHAVRDANCPDVVKTVLRLFSTYNAKAVTKYEAILRAAGEDARLRGMFLYHGAGTGRWASMIVQLQNLFRPVIEDTDRAIDVILQRDLGALRQAYPDHDPMRVLASCVRGMLVASPGRVLASCVRGMLVASPGRILQSLDFSGNEARGNAWLFGEEWKLKAYRAFDEGRGPDLYKMAYSRAFRVDPESVDKQQRQIGKVMELALGYEGGANAFVTMAANYGVDLDEMASLVRQALHPTIVERSHFKWERFGAQTGLPYDTYIACDGLVQLWRDAHPRIVAGWKQLRDAAADAVRHPGRVFAIRSRRIRFRVQDQWLYMRLPSGRCLAYFRPEVDESGALTYMGVDTYTRRWMRTATYGGKLCENAVQALSRDLLVHAMHGLEAAGYETVMTVHDEIVSDIPEDHGSLEEASRIMCTLPAWAEGFPVATEGWRARRYRK